MLRSVRYRVLYHAYPRYDDPDPLTAYDNIFLYQRCVYLNIRGVLNQRIHSVKYNTVDWLKRDFITLQELSGE